MKHIILYVLMTLVVFAMVYIISVQESEFTSKVLTVDTAYHFIDADSQNIYLEFYINDDEHLLTDKSNISSLYIHNLDDSKGLFLELDDVVYQHDESYLNETYHKYVFKCLPPLLNEDLILEDCYLDVAFINEDSHTFYLGMLSLTNPSEYQASYLNWSALSGTKAQGSYLSRLNQIIVEYHHLDTTIRTIGFGHETLDFDVNASQITIDIPYQNHLLFACPLLITFDDNQQQIIDYFVYIKDYEILKQSGQLIYHYALD